MSVQRAAAALAQGATGSERPAVAIAPSEAPPRAAPRPTTNLRGPPEADLLCADNGGKPYRMSGKPDKWVYGGGIMDGNDAYDGLDERAQVGARLQGLHRPARPHLGHGALQLQGHGQLDAVARGLQLELLQLRQAKRNN